ncbi:hypothetical protein S13b_00078 [Klebsiella phage VLCpiS13b]|uniref:hypothetical protein n=1 Tax=Klebsiella phage VLCpiS13b TaxID=2874886 RepID=UPI00233F3442|nr:hypothetical protein PRB92_gp47 [Klebsiella phage VLCpiS13b]UVX30653.1 hypothetical protein S13b_00078 [Klebsiella phage VLCpiS13b]
MTKSTITRERLAKIKSWRETYGAGSNVMLPAEEAEELARIALAAMDSEPVAYIFKHPAGRLFWSLTDESNKGHDDVMPVYASPQPAPVVNYVTLGDSPYDVPCSMPSNLRELIAEEIGILFSDDDAQSVWNVCRHAAMLERQLVDRVDEKSLTSINPAPDLVSLQKKAESIIGNSPVIPDGYVMVPMRLTAENGAKGALSGEFSETKFVNCPECFGDDECETCDSSGRIEITVPVSWTNIKEIWAKGVEHFAAAPQELKK